MPTTNYIWDEENILAEIDQNNVVQTVYTNEPEPHGNLVSTRIAGASSYHQFDAIGSTRQLTNAAGATTDTAVYDASGNVVNRTGTTGVNLLWIGESGYYYDPETGLFHAHERTYGPMIARWTAVDPAGFHETLDRYVYVLNQVVQLIDPSGRFCVAKRCNGGAYLLRTGPCATYEQGDDVSLGKEFTVTVAITGPDCDCCWYRQYVKGRQLLRLISRQTGKGRDEVYDASDWHEDCIERPDPNNPKNKIDYCRGKRTSRFFGPGKADFPATDAYCPDRKSGCLYRSWDFPAVNIPLQIAEDYDKDYIVEARVDLRFRIVLVDKCAVPETEMILGEFDITCSPKMDLRSLRDISLAPATPCPITLR